YPLTEEFHGCDPQGWCGTMQYFERAIFEWHPGIAPSRYDVQLGLVGDQVTAGRATQAPFQPTAAQAGCTYFAATGHNLCGAFQSYWNQYGGLALYGMPISEPFVENGLTVQYFERARFELHPGTNPALYNVLLGRLGAQILDATYGLNY
ncbi:MAG TPA: ferritin-like domain-containing protein, partial [Thermomicrobiaceae bacterium]|nr:ferritin-like domain-containing protein [Thermomicrobiaceae bacterium]